MAAAIANIATVTAGLAIVATAFVGSPGRGLRAIAISVALAIAAALLIAAVRNFAP